VKDLVKRLLALVGLRLTRNWELERLHRPQDPLKRARRILGPELTRRVPWKHEDVSLQHLKDSSYYRLWSQFGGGHKKYSYFRLYDRLFSDYVGRRPKVLEIGVYKGASIRTWRGFFGEGSRVVGIDVNPDCAQYEDVEQDIHVRIGSQADTGFLQSVNEELGPFDIILDDGSHLTHHVIATFNHAFLHCLAEGGIYFIEDLNTSYWTKYRTSKYSAMDMVLSLCEMTHQFYFDHAYENYSRENQREFSSPAVCTWIDEVRVFDSAAAIYKNRCQPPLVFHT